MTTVPATSLAMLDRLTDPADAALARLRDKLDTLAGEIIDLKSAQDENGLDVRAYLCTLASDAYDCLDDLAAVVEPRG